MLRVNGLPFDEYVRRPYRRSRRGRQSLVLIRIEAERAQRMKRQGFSVQAIAGRLGISEWMTYDRLRRDASWPETRRPIIPESEWGIAIIEGVLNA